MKKLIQFLLIFFVIGCVESRYDLVPGATGANGKDGTSTVLSVRLSALGESNSCAYGGTQVEVVENGTTTDTFPICNGAPGTDGQDGSDGNDGLPGQDGQDGADGQDGSDGQDGEDGEDGENTQLATFTDYDTNTCTRILTTAFYVKGESIYDDNDCHSSDKVAVLTGGDDLYWVASKIVATERNGDGIRVINFN
jgi:hypothetical protein